MDFPPLSIVGLGALSALGEDVAGHRDSVENHRAPFRELGEILGRESPHAAKPGSWISNRALLIHRKWSPATMAALHVAREAIAEAGWSAAELRDAALVLGTSRGNAAGWLSPWPGRRPFRLMAASNTIHCEPASAISIEFQITGPNHVLASGCAAGLDAIGLAMMLVRSGAAPRALAVAVDLPLVPMLLDSYAASGVLTKSFRLDPYHPETSGFIPAEGAAAMAIDGEAREKHLGLSHYVCNSDASDPVGIPKDGGRTPELFAALAKSGDLPASLCPHATGTAVQAAADPAILTRVFSEKKRLTLHLLKPFLGHSIGASGLLESVILCEFKRRNLLPPNLPGLHAPEGYILPDMPMVSTGSTAKLSHGMGGHNSLLVISGAGKP